MARLFADDILPALQHLTKTLAAIGDRDIKLALTDELVKEELLKNASRMGNTRVCYMRGEDDRDDPSKSQQLPKACNRQLSSRVHTAHPIA